MGRNTTIWSPTVTVTFRRGGDVVAVTSPTSANPLSTTDVVTIAKTAGERLR